MMEKNAGEDWLIEKWVKKGTLLWCYFNSTKFPNFDFLIIRTSSKQVWVWSWTKLHTVDIFLVCIDRFVKLKSLLLRQNAENFQLVVSTNTGNEISFPTYTVDWSFVGFWYCEKLLSIFPNNQGSIFTTTNDVLTARTKIKLPNSWTVTCHRLTANPVVNAFLITPALYAVIVTSAVQKVSIRIPFHEFYVLWVSWQYGLTREIIIFVSFPYPYCFISAACRNQGAIVIEIYRFNFVFVAFQRTDRFKIFIFLLPNYCSSIKGCRC